MYRVTILHPDGFSEEANVSSDSHTFTGVLKGRTYDVTVMAFNVIGESTLANTTIGELNLLTKQLRIITIIIILCGTVKIIIINFCVCKIGSPIVALCNQIIRQTNS